MSAVTNIILIVEDEAQLASLVQDYLQKSGYSTHIIGRGDEVVPWLQEHKADLILLDIMLPGDDGMSVCKSIRSFSSVPIIMLTARVEEIDRLLGLELGADDYVCKPFSPREVVARVKAVLRRGHGNIVANEDVVLDEARHVLSIKGTEVELTAVEFQLLNVLRSEPGRIYSRSRLMDHIYPDHRIVSDRTIDRHIKKLRKKISGLDSSNESIHSVYGVGHKFEYD